jgi:hypothetical protein
MEARHMSGSISFNPYKTTVSQNSFVNPTQGFISGVALDDPSSKNWLMGGTLDTAETVVMWGGVPISEEINQLTNGSEGLGPAVKRATSQSNTTGFSVFNQAGSMVITPGNSVPVAAIGNYVSFYRLGTNARIVVACDTALVAALTAGELTNGAAIYWSVTNYNLTLTTSGSNFALPTSLRLLTVQTNSLIVTYSASTPSWTTGDAAVIQI